METPLRYLPQIPQQDNPSIPSSDSQIPESGGMETPLRRLPQIPQQDAIEFEAEWGKVEAAVSKLKRILARDIDVYNTIYSMCIKGSIKGTPQRYQKPLYERYKMILQDYVRYTVLPSLNKKHGEFLLRELVERWNNHKVLVNWLSSQFSYLDRFYVKRSHKVLLPLRELGTSCFHDLVFNELKTKLTTIVIDMVNDERDGQLIDRALVKDVLHIYIELGRGSVGLYKLHFEEYFCDCSKDYYSKKAQAWMLEASCSEYMFKAEECLQKEKERVSHYLHSSTSPKLIEDIIILELLTRYAEQILNKDNSGCRVLLLDGKTEDLSRMYRLFSRMEDGLSQVLKIFREHVNEEGMSLLKSATDVANSRKHVTEEGLPLLKSATHAANSVKDFAQKALELHEKQITYVTSCFQNDAEFHEVLYKAFKLFCNEDAADCSFAESLAAFCDDILNKGGSDEAVEATLDKVVDLLAYISDKDLFVEFLRWKLARRLLFHRSVSYERERSFLSRLNTWLGRVFTSKMEGMLADMGTARKHQKSFELYAWYTCPESVWVDMSVEVLRTGLWPSYKTFEINLPIEMANCVEVFKKYYLSKHKDRTLTWIYALGNCTISAKFDTKTVELIVTTYQAALLLLFNEADRLSCSEIVTQLNMPHDEAVQLLRSLWCVKYKILDKDPSSDTVTPTDIFWLNSEFTVEGERIKVPPPPIVEKKQFMGEGRPLAEACLVRIMKAREVITHSELVAECIKKLAPFFKPSTDFIKRRIDSLISREFMEHDRWEVPRTYRYIP